MGDQGIMDKMKCLGILKNKTRQSVRKMFSECQWTFQHDNNPKHTVLLATKHLDGSKIKILEYSAQSSDQNRIENLWVNLKKNVKDRNLL